jgi:protein ImuA
VIDGGPAQTCAAIATVFIGGILARLSGPVLWRCRGLFAPALARIGLHPDP